MRLFRVEALVDGEWVEWTVLAVTKEAAIAATGVDTSTVNAWDLDAFVLSKPSQGLEP